MRILVQHEPGIGRDTARPDRLPRELVGLRRVDVVGSAELVGRPAERGRSPRRVDNPPLEPALVAAQRLGTVRQSERARKKPGARTITRPATRWRLSPSRRRCRRPPRRRSLLRGCRHTLVVARAPGSDRPSATRSRGRRSRSPRRAPVGSRAAAHSCARTPQSEAMLHSTMLTDNTLTCSASLQQSFPVKADQSPSMWGASAAALPRERTSRWSTPMVSKRTRSRSATKRSSLLAMAVATARGGYPRATRCAATLAAKGSPGSFPADGRGWARTSDLSRVRRALSH